MVLAATAIPIGLRWPAVTLLSFTPYRSDVVLNILGYLPLGFVLANRGLWRAAVSAAAISMLAEAGQLFMVHRQPSAIDVVCNVVGAILGALAVRRLRPTTFHVPLHRR